MGKKKGISDNVRNRKKNRTQVRVNPFEVKVNKVKSSVVNRKLQKWEKGVPGVSRSKAIKKRKDNLLSELHHMGKANLLHDKRFGENDTNLTADEKMIQRFALEKKKQSQKGGFNLMDEDEEVLTHYGQTLAENLQDEIGSDSDDEADHVRTGDLQFGGFSNSDEMSFKDKMSQVIAESKKHKFEKQAEKEKNVEATKELDDNWRKSVFDVLNPLKKDAKDRKPTSTYMQLFHNLLREQTSAGATDKSKTEEEIAKEEAEKLQILEAERLSRMSATSESKQTKKHESADSLNDCFALDDDNKNKKVLRFALNPKQNDGDDEDDEDDDGDDNDDDDNDGDEDGEDNGNDDEEKAESSGEESDDGDESDQFSDLASEQESDGEDQDIQSVIADSLETSAKSILKKHQQKTASKDSDGKNELPYLFSAPGSFSELETLLHGHSSDEQTVIISRLRKCHHPSLAEGNKEKLEKIHLFLLQYFGKLASEPRLDQMLINCLTGHLWELTQTFKSSTAEALQKYVLQRQTEHAEFTEKKGRGAFPRNETLMHLVLIDALFPTSDFRHPVVTPAFHFIAQLLTECSPRSFKDVSTGLFLCSIALRYVNLSKRYIPEVVTFIHGLLTLACPPEVAPKKGWKLFPPFKKNSKAADLLVLKETCEEFPEKLSVSEPKEENEISSNQLNCYAMNSLVGLMVKCLNLWSELPSIAHVVEPWLTVLKVLPLTYYPDKLQEKIKALLERLSSINTTLKMMQQASKKPVPLKLFEPKIEESWSGKKKKGGSNKTVNEKQRLVHKHRRELKAAVREIKRDSEVLAKHKLDTVMQADVERKRKMKELMHGLAVQEGDYKAMKRMKKD